MIAVAALSQSAAATSYAATPPSPSPAGDIGLMLLDAPVSRRDDPRARVYIIDFLVPGTTISRRVQVSNTSATTRSIQLYAGAATIKGTAFTFGDNRTPNELSTWISFDRTLVPLAPKAKSTVLVTIRVPKQASSGERYAVIWAQTTSLPTKATNVGMVSRVGVRVYLGAGAGGEPPSNFQIESLTPGRTPTRLPEVFIRVRNTGGRAVDLSGSLMLTNGPGSMSAGPFPVAGGTTLAPGGVGLATVVLNKLLPNGPWHAHVALNSGLINRTADATITFPAAGVGASVMVQANTSGTLFSGPLMMILLILSFSGLIAVGIRALLRRTGRLAR